LAICLHADGGPAILRKRIPEVNTTHTSGGNPNLLVESACCNPNLMARIDGGWTDISSPGKSQDDEMLLVTDSALCSRDGIAAADRNQLGHDGPSGNGE